VTENSDNDGFLYTLFYPLLMTVLRRGM